MFGSILVKMPEITKEFDEEIGIEVINNYFVRLKSDVYIPIFNLPLLHPEVFRESSCDIGARELADITFRYYKKYIKLRKQKQFKVKVFLPEKYGGYALYYILQKFMINEATSNEIEIVSEFLSKYIFDGKDIDMWELIYWYYMSICGYDVFKKSILVNTPVGNTPLYVLDIFLNTYNNKILTTFLEDYTVAFVSVLTSHFFGKNIQIGSHRFRLLKSIGELDFNWNNVKVISFRELYDVSNAIIENNLKMTFPRTSLRIYVNECLSKDVFLSHSPILSTVGSAIDFKNKSVMFLFAMLKRRYDNTTLTKFNHLFYLNKKEDVEYFVVSIPFKNIRKFVYKKGANSGIFVIEQGGKVIPVLSLYVDKDWLGVGRENIVRHHTDYDLWYGLLRRLASPEHLKMAEEKTQEWLKDRGY